MNGPHIPSIDMERGAPLVDARVLAVDRPTVAALPADDDLCRIQGIDARLERRLHTLDIRRFDQIANWTDDDVRYVSTTLGLNGAIASETWIAQAEALARADRAAETSTDGPLLPSPAMPLPACAYGLTADETPGGTLAVGDLDAGALTSDGGGLGRLADAYAPREGVATSEHASPAAPVPLPLAAHCYALSPLAVNALSVSAENRAEASAEAWRDNVQDAVLAAPPLPMFARAYAALAANVETVESAPAAVPDPVPDPGPVALSAPPTAPFEPLDVQPDYSALQPPLPLAARDYPAPAIDEPLTVAPNFDHVEPIATHAHALAVALDVVPQPEPMPVPEPVGSLEPLSQPEPQSALPEVAFAADVAPIADVAAEASPAPPIVPPMPAVVIEAAAPPPVRVAPPPRQISESAIRNAAAAARLAASRLVGEAVFSEPAPAAPIARIEVAAALARDEVREQDGPLSRGLAIPSPGRPHVFIDDGLDAADADAHTDDGGNANTEDARRNAEFGRGWRSADGEAAVAIRHAAHVAHPAPQHAFDDEADNSAFDGANYHAYHATVEEAEVEIVHRPPPDAPASSERDDGEGPARANRLLKASGTSPMGRFLKALTGQ